MTRDVHADRLTELEARLAEAEARLADSRAREAALARRVRLLSEAQQVAEVGSWEWDVAADQVTWSDQLYRIYDVPPGTPMDYAGFLARVHPEDVAHVRESVERLFQGAAAVQFMHRILRPDGSLRTLAAHAKVELDEAGRPTRMIGTGHDVTERERLQHERIEALLEADRLKDHFLGILSHELRTPLNAVSGFASVLAEGLAGPVTPKQAEYLERILAGADDLVALIDDLLDMTRVRAGQLLLLPAEVDFAALVGGVLARLEPLAGRKDHVVGADLAPDLPAVRADARRVEQVLVNLVGNAVKFVPRGGRITVRARAEGAFLRCEVEDDGPGVPPEARATIFEPFTQAGTTPTREFGGAGLGLSIARAFVQAHGGAIGVESELGAGATFWFTLPRHPSPHV